MKCPSRRLKAKEINGEIDPGARIHGLVATHIYQWPLCAHVPAECWASCREQSPRGPREETSKQGLPNIVKSYQGIRVFKPEAGVGDL